MRLSSVRFAYGGKPVLDELSLELWPGATVLLGPNGSGKSTLISLVAGRLRPDSGSVVLQAATPGAPTRVGYAAQHPEVDPEMTAREHLRLFGALAGRTGADLAADVDAAIALFSLGSFADLWVARMSGGMRRRLHLAISALSSPQVWLLDEPTTGLDPQGRDALHRAIRASSLRGSTVFFATHDLAFAEEVASRVMVVEGGRCLADTTVADAMAEHGSLADLYAFHVGEAITAGDAGIGRGRRRGGGGGRGGGRRHA